MEEAWETNKPGTQIYACMQKPNIYLYLYIYISVYVYVYIYVNAHITRCIVVLA